MKDAVTLLAEVELAEVREQWARLLALDTEFARFFYSRANASDADLVRWLVDRRLAFAPTKDAPIPVDGAGLHRTPTEPT